MECEARILRVLRALEYPGLDEAPGSGSTPALGLASRPHDLAKIVTWIEDRKVCTRNGIGRLGKADQLLLAEYGHIVGASLELSTSGINPTAVRKNAAELHRLRAVSVLLRTQPDLAPCPVSTA